MSMRLARLAGGEAVAQPWRIVAAEVQGRDEGFPRRQAPTRRIEYD
jgi:hypothetical protein